MAMETLTVQVPSDLYRLLQQRAEQSQRSVEEELVMTLASVVSDEDRLSDDHREAIYSLVLLDDEALWNAARSRLPIEEKEELADLNSKQQREGLTQAERDRQGWLVHEYQRFLLIRAYSAVLLKQRGYDITSLGPQS